MSFCGNSKLTKYSQKLRRNMTKEERHLWYDFLKTLPFTIQRQKTFGNYILDFYCSEPMWLLKSTVHNIMRMPDFCRINDAMRI